LKTTGSTYGNRKYIEKLLKERRGSEDPTGALGKRGCSFSRAQRSFYLKEDLYTKI